MVWKRRSDSRVVTHIPIRGVSDPVVGGCVTADAKKYQHDGPLGVSETENDTTLVVTLKDGRTELAGQHSSGTLARIGLPYPETG